MANILKKIFGGKSVGGSVADAVVGTAEGVANIVERWAPSDAAKHEMYMAVNKLVADNAANARAYTQATSGTSPFMDVVNGLVDAAARTIRPGVTILLIGAVFGWWPVHTSNLDPVVLGWGEAVMAFWFGARTLFKDIPSLIKVLKEARK